MEVRFQNIMESVSYFGAKLFEEGRSGAAEVATQAIAELRALFMNFYTYKYEWVVLIFIFLAGLIVTSNQQLFMSSTDIWYESGEFPILDYGMNYFGVPLRHFYVWFIDKTNAIFIYFRNCINDAILGFKDISSDDLLTIEGVTEVIDIMWDAIVCISEYIFKVPQVYIKYYTPFVEQNILLMVCGGDIAESILVNVVKGTIFSEDCVFCMKLDPSHNCLLVGNAFPGVQPNCTKETCHNYEYQWFGCVGNYVTFFFDAFGIGTLDNIFNDICDACACIYSLWKRPVFVITGFITNSLVDDGCMTIEDIPNQFVDWMDDWIECATELIEIITDDVIQDFFQFVFKYIFWFIQIIIDSIEIIYDCFSDNKFVSCIESYPTNCGKSFPATSGLQTCYQDLYTCWNDPDNVLMAPLFAIDFFPISKYVYVIIDSVICPSYNMVVCIYNLPGNCDWDCLENAFDCVSGGFDIFQFFSKALSEFCATFGGMIDDINQLYSDVKWLDDQVDDIWNDISSIFKKKSFTPDFNFRNVSTSPTPSHKKSYQEILYEAHHNQNLYSNVRKSRSIDSMIDNECVNNVFYNDNEAIYMQFDKGCTPIDAIKLSIICFIDGGLCLHDKGYDDLIFYEYYTTKMSKKRLAEYADIVWSQVIDFISINNNNSCYDILKRHHPLKEKPSPTYMLCFNGMKYYNYGKMLFKTPQNNKTSIHEYNSLIPLSSYGSLSSYQQSETLRIINMAKRVNSTFSKINAEKGNPFIWVGKQIHKSFIESEYYNIMNEYISRMKLLRNIYKGNITISNVDDEDFWRIVGELPNSATDDDHEKKQGELFLHYTGKAATHYWKDKPVKKKGCTSNNNIFKHCKSTHTWEPRKKYEGGTEIMIYDEDDYRRQKEIEEYNEEMILRHKEEYENHNSEFSEAIGNISERVSNASQRHNYGRAFDTIHDFTGIGNWTSVKVSHAFVTSWLNGTTYQLFNWLSGKLKYDVKTGFSRAHPDWTDTLIDPDLRGSNKFQERMDEKKKKAEEFDKNKPRKYFFGPIFGREYNKESENYTSTILGIPSNLVWDYLYNVSANSNGYATGNYTIYNQLNNGTYIFKQFSKSDFNLNDVIIDEIDNIIYFFGAPERYIRKQYDNLLDYLSGVNLQGFAKDSLVNYVETFLTCHIPENINGTYVWNILCFPILPINALDWLQYLPTSAFPIQIPWPEDIIKDNCVNHYNGDHGIFTYKPSDNCGEPGDRPFCPFSDYCARTYHKCPDLGYEYDVLDTILYMFAVLPRVINWFFLSPIPMLTAEFIAFALLALMIPVIGPFVVIPYVAIIIIFWAVNIVTPGVPMSFIVAMLLIISIIFIPALLNLAQFVVTLALVFLTMWFMTLFFGFTPLNINLIQAWIDVTNWFRNTPGVSNFVNLLFGDLQFLVDRYEKFNYGMTGSIPGKDTACFIISFGQIACSIGVLVIAWYVFKILFRAGVIIIAAGSKILRSGGDSAQIHQQGNIGSALTAMFNTRSRPGVPAVAQNVQNRQPDISSPVQWAQNMNDNNNIETGTFMVPSSYVDENITPIEHNPNTVFNEEYERVLDTEQSNIRPPAPVRPVKISRPVINLFDNKKKKS